jgi:glutaredoxin-dependent peroxiredoxin
MPVEIGQTAPDFTLYDSEKNQVTLSELKGQPILLLLFPLAFTSVCIIM